jgi:hypothetical protein
MTLDPNRHNQQTTPFDIGSDFDNIVTQLRSMLSSLQNRVMLLSTDLQTAAEVSTQIATILDPEKTAARVG